MKFKSEPRAIHGGRGTYIAGSDSGILDFSASINPYPPDIDLSVPSDALIRYPDDEYLILKETIARHHGCHPEQITVGNGSVEVIRTLCHTVLTSDSTYYVPPHTFAEYELSARLTGASKEYEKEKATLSFICNPDNPSGILIPKDTLKDQILALEGREHLCCVDEAFIDLSDPSQSLTDFQNSRLFVLRSLTKSFAIPGVRFGYGIGDPELISSMEVMRPPWTVNAFAEKVVLSAFSRYSDLETSRKKIFNEKKHLIEAIRRMGFSLTQASANYLLIDTGYNAEEVTKQFYKSGILVRDCTSFDLPTCIRVAVRTAEENTQFIEAMEKVVSCMRS